MTTCFRLLVLIIVLSLSYLSFSISRHLSRLIRILLRCSTFSCLFQPSRPTSGSTTSRFEIIQKDPPHCHQLEIFLWYCIYFPKNIQLQFDWKKAHLQLSELSKKYGGVFTIWLPRPFVIVTDYDVLKEAFQAKGEDFSERTGMFPDIAFMNVENGGVLFSSVGLPYFIAVVFSTQ